LRLHRAVKRSSFTRRIIAQVISWTWLEVGVPYGNRTRVAAVKEKRFTGIQRKPAAWIAPQGSQRYSKESLLDP
jgi:hypothetical protein